MSKLGDADVGLMAWRAALGVGGLRGEDAGECQPLAGVMPVPAP